MTSPDKDGDGSADADSYKQRADEYIATAIEVIKTEGEEKFSKTVKRSVRNKQDGHPVLAPLHKKLFPENSDT